MDRLEFRTRPLTQEELRQSRSRLEQGRSWWLRRVRLPLGTAGISFSLPALLLCGAFLIAIGTGAPTGVVNGTAVKGRHILLVVDVSGSMDKKKNALLEQQTSNLGSSLLEDRSSIMGFGVAFSGDGQNLLHVLQQDLQANPGVDAVYVFSDFEPNTESWDCNDQAGLDPLRQLVHNADVRLYLSTVEMLPSSGLLDIARGSGGGLINGVAAQDSLKSRQDLCHFNQ